MAMSSTFQAKCEIQNAKFKQYTARDNRVRVVVAACRKPHRVCILNLAFRIANVIS